MSCSTCPCPATPTDDPTAAGPTDEPLLAVMLSFLVPLLMAGGVSDAGLAAAAARAAIASYQAGAGGAADAADAGAEGDAATGGAERGGEALLTITQIVAYALAGLDALCSASAPALSPSTKLKLRGNANALNRTSRHGAAALAALRTVAADVEAAAGLDETWDEAASLASLDAAQAMLRQTDTAETDAAAYAAATRTPEVDAAAAVDEAKALTEAAAVDEAISSTKSTMAGPLLTSPIALSMRPDAPPATMMPSAPSAANTGPTGAGQIASAAAAAVPPSGVAWTETLPSVLSTRRTTRPLAHGPLAQGSLAHNQVWANAMTEVAAECRANLPRLTPAQRRQEMLRIEALHTTAHTLGNGRMTLPALRRTDLLASTAMPDGLPVAAPAARTRSSGSSHKARSA